MDIASVTPHVNQVEFHPFQNPMELREFCKENRIQMEVCVLKINLKVFILADNVKISFISCKNK